MDALPEIRVRSLDLIGDSAPLENPLSREEQEQLRGIAKFVEYKRGMTLYSQGEQARSVYLIASGIVRLNRCDETGHRQVLAFRVLGDFCGIPDGTHYFNSAEAVSESGVYRFESQQLLDVCMAEPHLRLVLLGKILHDYREAQIRISILGQLNTCQRLASFILDSISIPEFFDKERSCLTLPVNRFDLADYLGTTPESAARAFAKLENFRLIRRITARRIELLDCPGLRLLQHTARRQYSADEVERPALAGSTADTAFEPVGA